MTATVRLEQELGDAVELACSPAGYARVPRFGDVANDVPSYAGADNEA